MEEVISSQNKIKLLLVDDEIDFLQTITERLELKDFDVIAASTGREALASAEKDFFDVAVVDFQMPGMDGYSLASHIKKKLSKYVNHNNDREWRK